jgi:hypothetical protein
MVAYHVTLNGQGYVLDLDQYKKRPRPPFAGKIAGGALSLDDLRGPEQVLRLTDWSGGEGQAQHDTSRPSRYRAGAGLDGYSAPGSVQLEPYAALIAATGEDYLGPMCAYNGKLYVGSGTGTICTWDGSTWANIGVAGASTTGRQIAFRITLAGTAGASTSPILYELTLRYVPRPAVTREWELAVVLEGTAELPMITLDEAPEPLTGVQLAAALWTAAGQADPVTFVDLDGVSYQVYVDDLREEMGKISQRRGYQRLGLVKLVEAA